MIGLGSVGSSSSDLYEILQHMLKRAANASDSAGTNETSAATRNVPHRPPSPTPPAPPPLPGITDAIEGEVDDAVSAAIEGFDASTGTVSDLMQSIKDAVDKVLSENGIQPPSNTGGYKDPAKMASPPPASHAPTIDSVLEDSGVSPQDVKDFFLQLFQQDEDSTSESTVGDAKSSKIASLLVLMMKNGAPGTLINTKA